jgi:hypothetical protein
MRAVECADPQTILIISNSKWQLESKKSTREKNIQSLGIFCGIVDKFSYPQIARF